MPVIEVYTNCYGESGLEAVFDHLPLPGCSAVELALKPHSVKEVYVTEEHTITEMSSDEEVEAGKARFESAGITVSAANGGDTVSDPKGVARIRRRIEIASRLGAKTFVSSIGWEGADPEEAYPVIRDLGEYAREHGLLFALETHSPYVVNAEAGLRTLGEVHCDNVLINWDTANIYYMNDGIDGAEELRKVASAVGHVHLKDSHMKAQEWFFPALGEGNIDFPEIFGILEAAEFNGTMSLEIEGIGGEVADLGLRRRRIETSLEYLMKEGLI